MNLTTPAINVGLNGLGIIGRLVYRLLSMEPAFRITKINDLMPRENLEYLLQHDSVHGRSSVTLQDIEITARKEVEQLDWEGLDIVIDATPHLRTYEELNRHREQGAKYVVRTSPLKKSHEFTQTIIPGVNDAELDVRKYSIFSLASCTTNCLAPLVKGMLDYCRQYDNAVEEMDFVTVHAYTADQLLKDGFHQDLSRGRGVDNIIETETGASSQIKVIFPELEGKIHGSCYRVPVADGSVLELRVRTTAELSLSAVNQYFRGLAGGDMKRILSYETAPLVSSDCLNDSHSCIYLEKSAAQLSPQKIKLTALYDNEFGYANRVVDLVREIQRKLNNNGYIKGHQEDYTVLGAVVFTHSQYSGHETVLFYEDHKRKMYYQVQYFDPFDNTTAMKELKLCPLSEKEVDCLLREKAAVDYQRFYDQKP